MVEWSFWDWIGYGGIAIAALFLAVDTAVAQSDSLARHVPRILKVRFLGFVPIFALTLGTGAFAYQQFGPADPRLFPKDAKLGSSFGRVAAWGADNDVFYMIVNTSSLERDKKFYKLVLIVRVPFSDIDEMTDINIKKSQSYTIMDGFVTLAVPMLSGAPLKVLLDRPTPIQYILAEIPYLFSPDDIKSVSDVERVGGRILDKTATQVQFASRLLTNSQGVCPSAAPAAPSRPPVPK